MDPSRAFRRMVPPLRFAVGLGSIATSLVLFGYALIGVAAPGWLLLGSVLVAAKLLFRGWGPAFEAVVLGLAWWILAVLMQVNQPLILTMPFGLTLIMLGAWSLPAWLGLGMLGMPAALLWLLAGLLPAQLLGPGWRIAYELYGATAWFLFTANRLTPLPARLNRPDVILASSSGNTAHYLEAFLAGARTGGAEPVIHRFHDHRVFHPSLTGDALILAFPVSGWKPPWTLSAYLWRRLPRGRGKHAFLVYTSAGGPENAAVVAWLLLALKGYRVVGRQWGVYPVNVATFRLGPRRLWRFFDRLLPREPDLAAVTQAGRDFVEGRRTGFPFILWPFPLLVAGIALDNKWVNRPLYRNHVIRRRCTRCGRCIRRCPLGRLSPDPDGYPRARGTCALCLACVNLCPTRAMHMAGFTEYGNPYPPKYPDKVHVPPEKPETNT